MGGGGKPLSFSYICEIFQRIKTEEAGNAN